MRDLPAARMLVLVSALLGASVLGRLEADASTGEPDCSESPDCTADEKLQTYLRGARAKLAPGPRDALDGIAGDARRLLALRGYLRAGQQAQARWAWSQAQIDLYETSAEGADALAEVERVRETFAQLNPGYALRVNTQVRSLDEQLRKWNQVESVGRAADELLAEARKEMSRPVHEGTTSEAGLQSFERFLRGFAPREQPTVATPGLSLHGSGRAFDFQVLHGTRLIAGTSTATAAEAWDRAGWTLRLQEAVRRASTKLFGPLSVPHEPWHYDYRP
jgi:hypothetical protein